MAVPVRCYFWRLPVRASPDAAAKRTKWPFGVLRASSASLWLLNALWVDFPLEPR